MKNEVLLVSCPVCLVQPGQLCLDAAGAPRNVHHRRLQTYNASRRYGEFRVVVRKDLPGSGIKANSVLVCRDSPKLDGHYYCVCDGTRIPRAATELVAFTHQIEAGS